MPDYTVKRAGFILGDHVNANTVLPMTEKQAKEFLREGRIVPKAAKQTDKPKGDAKS